MRDSAWDGKKAKGRPVFSFAHLVCLGTYPCGPPRPRPMSSARKSALERGC